MKNLFSLNDCYEIWKKNNQNKLNPLTLRRYTNLVENHLLPYFKDIEVRDITEKDIKLFLEKKQKDGMGEVTRNMTITLLRKFLQEAEVDMTKLGLKHTIRVKQSKRTVEIMEEKEQVLLDEMLNESNDEKYISICLAYKLGLAIGEICALRWENIDFDREVVRVREKVQRIQNSQTEQKIQENEMKSEGIEKNENKQKNADIEKTKNIENSENSKKTILVKMQLSDTTKRELPVPKAVLKMLKLCRKENGYVLKCKEGKIPDPRREQMRLEKVFKRNEMKGCNFHTLRDTFAVRCLRAGMSIEDLSYVLGHSSVTGTAERYKAFVETKENRVVVLKRIMELV